MDHRSAQTPVRSQGNRATCVGFAVASAHEWHRGNGERLSVEDVMWAGHQVDGVPGREEIKVQWALEGLDAHNHATETAWPYGQPHWSDGRPAVAADDLVVLPVWERVVPVDYDRVVAAVAAARPVVLTVGFVPAAWYGSGQVDAPRGQRVRGSHAVVVVGASADPDALTVKNSWGENWRQAGYGTLTRPYLEEYGVVAHILLDGGGT